MSSLYKKLIIFLGVSIGMQAGNGSLTVISKSFEPSNAIPAKYSYKGGNIAPHLSWTQGPQGTQSYAIICNENFYAFFYKSILNSVLHFQSIS